MLCSRRDAEAAVAAAALRAAAAASIHQILTGLWLCGLSHRLCLQLTSKSLSHGQMKAKRALVVVATTEQLWNYFNRSSVTGVHMCVSVCVWGGSVCVCTHSTIITDSSPTSSTLEVVIQRAPTTFLLKALGSVPYSYWQRNACPSVVPTGLLSPAWSLCLSLSRTEGKKRRHSGGSIPS